MNKISIDMTPMIDIVFQLLIFFVMTLNITPPEGDLAMQMPTEGASEGAPHVTSLPPMTLALRADERGDCSAVQLNQRSFEGEHRWKELHDYIERLIGQGVERADVEVQIVADFDLKHEHVIMAITAISGSIGEDGRVIKMVEKIKFSPPKSG